MFKAKIDVTLKKSVLDPQGQTVLHALHTLGHEGVESMRVGKHFEISLKAKDVKEAEANVRKMCDQLLTNPIIEDYALEVVNI